MEHSVSQNHCFFEVYPKSFFHLFLKIYLMAGVKKWFKVTILRIVFGVGPWYLNIQFNIALLLFKINFKTDEKFNAKGIKTMVFEIYCIL